MNKTLKKLIIIAIVSVAIYFGLIPFLYCLDWYEMNKTGSVMFGGLFAMPSTKVLNILLITFFVSALLSIIFVFFKKTRKLLFYLIPTCVLCWIATDNPIYSRYDLTIRIYVHGNIYEDVSFKQTPSLKNPESLQDFKTTLYSRWGKKLLDVKGKVEIFRQYNNYDMYYIVDLYSDNGRSFAEVYDKNADFVMFVGDESSTDLKRRLEDVLDSYN